MQCLGKELTEKQLKGAYRRACDDLKSVTGGGSELRKYMSAMKNKTGSGPPDKEPERKLNFFF
jgi:hypothetical protein